jgi:hypothetical protein
MNDSQSLHREAMILAELAAEARLRGQKEEHLQLTRQAEKLETDAALQFKDAFKVEPTRSILFRSAASLALECGNVENAERLIATALSGFPPEQIADELRDLLEDVYFQRHLELRGVTLNSGDVQMTLEGESVGFGIARSDMFVQRIRDLETMLYRTAERRLGRPFREAGRRAKKLADGFELYISVPRAASFSVTLKLGQSSQAEMFGDSFSEATMKAVLDGLSLVNAGDIKALEVAIPDGPYLLNFLALAQRLAPDGKDIRTVGFTTMADNKSQVVALVTPQRELRRIIARADDDAAPDVTGTIEVVGVLLEANAKNRDMGSVEIVDDNQKPTRFIVPKGMMGDIVKPMFEERVCAAGSYADGKLMLRTITLIEA